MKDARVLLAMLGFALAALFGILARPLLPVDETRYLAVAWEMHVSGNWLVPHLNGAVYSHKPPLLFWLINLVWSVFGVTETAARLVGPAFGAAAIGLTGVLARRLWPDRPGVAGTAALVLAGFGVFALYAGLVMFDAMLTVAVLLGALALTRADRAPRWWLWLGMALALGAFAKGPVILLHLVPLALSAPLWSGLGWRRAILGVLGAVVTGCAIVALWLVPAIAFGGPEYRDAVLWTQSAARVGGNLGHGRPWWFFLALLPLVAWPWVWSREVLATVVRPDWQDRGLRFCWIWIGASILLFSLIGGKQIHYLLPTLPAFALVIARSARFERIGLLAAGLLPLVLGLALIALSLGFIPGEEAAALARPEWAIAAVGGLFLVLAFALAFLKAPMTFVAGPALAALASLTFLVGAPGRIYDAAELGGIIAPRDQAGIGLLGDYSGEWTFAARLRRPITTFDTPEAAEDWLGRTPGAVLIARLDKQRPARPPEARIAYNGRPYGVWTSVQPAVCGVGEVCQRPVSP